MCVKATPCLNKNETIICGAVWGSTCSRAHGVVEAHVLRFADWHFVESLHKKTARSLLLFPPGNFTCNIIDPVFLISSNQWLYRINLLKTSSPRSHSAVAVRLSSLWLRLTSLSSFFYEASESFCFQQCFRGDPFLLLHSISCHMIFCKLSQCKANETKIIKRSDVI